MSDDDADPELLELLRKSLGIQTGPPAAPETQVMESAIFIRDNSIDVVLDMYGTKAAAEYIWTQMQQRSYSRATWSQHELHPSAADMAAADRLRFIFATDLLNFSFWSDRGDDDEERWAVAYRGRRWTGYWGLVAALRRALDDGVDLTDPHFWHNGDMTLDTLERVFRSDTADAMPMLKERFEILLEAGQVLCQVSE